MKAILVGFGDLQKIRSLENIRGYQTGFIPIDHPAECGALKIPIKSSEEIELIEELSVLVSEIVNLGCKTEINWDLSFNVAVEGLSLSADAITKIGQLGCNIVVNC